MLAIRTEDLAELGLAAGARPSLLVLKAAYRRRALAAHPDRGGTPAAFAALTAAYQRVFAALTAEDVAGGSCAGCRGTGRVEVRKGFVVLNQVCPACHGRGRDL